jgi:pimeloyl-ACP methyl ester carboxylesterase
MSRVDANGLTFEVDLAGPPGAPAMFLVMGLGMQLIAWPKTLLRLFHEGGFRTLVFDQRDAGLTSKLDAAGRPNFIWANLRKRFGLRVKAAYGITDMADDVVAIASALDVADYHLVGVSMGGMIGQHVAARSPKGLRSFTAIMSTSGAPSLPGPSRESMKVLFAPMPKKTDVDAMADRYVRLFRVIGSPAYPTDEKVLRERAREAVLRAESPDGTLRHMMAILVDGDRSPLLKNIRVPTLVIHGEADVLVPAEGGKDIASKIPGARLLMIPGLGHDLPEGVIKTIGDAIVSLAREADASTG